MIHWVILSGLKLFMMLKTVCEKASNLTEREINKKMSCVSYEILRWFCEVNIRKVNFWNQKSERKVYTDDDNKVVM